MPLVKCQIPHPTASPELLQSLQSSTNKGTGAKPGPTLEVASFIQLLHGLEQLRLLATHAADIVGDWHQRVTQLKARSQRLQQRLDVILPSAQQFATVLHQVGTDAAKVVEQTMGEVTAETALLQAQLVSAAMNLDPERRLTEWHPPPQYDAVEFALLTPASQNALIAKRYQEANPPPALHLLDAYREDGVPCMKLYSYPQFFFDTWKNLMLRESEAKRKQKRDKKKNKVAAPQGDKNRALNSIEAIEVKRYNAMGELITPTKMNSLAAPSIGSLANLAQPNIGSLVNLTQPNIGSLVNLTQPMGGSNRSNPGSNERLSAEQKRLSLENVQQKRTSPNPTKSKESIVEAIPIPQSQKEEAVEVERTPAPPKVAAAPPPPPPPLPPVFAGPPPPPLPTAPPTQGSAPPPPGPPPPPPSSTSIQADLLSSVQLKKTEPRAPAASTDSRSNLMASIRQGTVQLRKVETTATTSTAASKSNNNDVAAILMRRAALEMSDSEDSNESAADDEWD